MWDVWGRDITLSERDVGYIELGPGERVRAPGPCSVVVRMTGSNGSSPFVVAPGTELDAGPDGGALGVVAWEGPAPRGDARIESTAPRYFGKYDSFQAQVTIQDESGDWIAPWEIYHVRMVADRQETVQLHVHHRVTNLLFVPGPIGEERGYLLVERDGVVTATPLVGGDRAIVRPNILHHVVPIRSGDPTEMIVFNNDRSSYENVEQGDFHIVKTIPWAEVAVQARDDPRPRLTVIE
ncbi:MAG: hypothetical protein AAGD14_01225 [Planctomycetota bacterium]